MIAVAATEDVGRAVWQRVNRRLLPPLFLISLLCQLDRSNLAFSALQMDSDLGFSRTVHGAGSGLFFVGYLAQIPANLACIALGPRRWLPIILAAWGAVAMGFAAVSGTASFLVLRLLLGIAEAGAYPAIMYLLSLFYPPRSLGLAYTSVATATAVAGLLGAPLAAALMLMNGIGGLRGWQWLFLIEGMLPILVAMVLPFLLPSSPLTASFLTPAQQQWLWREVRGHGKDIELVATGAAAVAGMPAAAASLAGNQPGPAVPAQAALDQAASSDREAHGSGGVEHIALLRSEQGMAGDSSGQEEAAGGEERLSKRTVRAGLLDRRVWHLAGAMLLIDVCMNSCNFWIPSLVKATLLGELEEDGEDASVPPSMSLLVKSSLLSSLPFCGAAVCMVANAHHAKMRDERRLHTVVPMLAAALGLGALPFLSEIGPAPALAALTLAASGIWATHGPFFSWPSAFLDQQSAAIGFAMVKTGGAVGGFAGPFMVGALADAFEGYTVAMLLLAGVAACAAALVYVFNDRLGTATSTHPASDSVP